ncbi:calmodulin-binding transcription activator [Pseudoscourfieldia marina]
MANSVEEEGEGGEGGEGGGGIPGAEAGGLVSAAASARALLSWVAQTLSSSAFKAHPLEGVPCNNCERLANHTTTAAAAQAPSGQQLTASRRPGPNTSPNKKSTRQAAATAAASAPAPYVNPLAGLGLAVMEVQKVAKVANRKPRFDIPKTLAVSKRLTSPSLGCMMFDALRRSAEPLSPKHVHAVVKVLYPYVVDLDVATVDEYLKRWQAQGQAQAKKGKAHLGTLHFENFWKDLVDDFTLTSVRGEDDDVRYLLRSEAGAECAPAATAPPLASMAEVNDGANDDAEGDHVWVSLDDDAALYPNMELARCIVREAAEGKAVDVPDDLAQIYEQHQNWIASEGHVAAPALGMFRLKQHVSNDVMLLGCMHCSANLRFRSAEDTRLGAASLESHCRKSHEQLYVMWVSFLETIELQPSAEADPHDFLFFHAAPPPVKATPPPATTTATVMEGANANGDNPAPPPKRAKLDGANNGAAADSAKAADNWPMAPPSCLTETGEVNVSVLFEQTQQRWLKNQEVYEVLLNCRKLCLPTTSDQLERPNGGTFFLVNRKEQRNFRRDGHNWQKKKDGKSLKETHEQLKVLNKDCLNCYYAHAEPPSQLQRRCYWLLEPPMITTQSGGDGDSPGAVTTATDDLVLVHYLDVSPPPTFIAGRSKASSALDIYLQHQQHQQQRHHPHHLHPHHAHQMHVSAAMQQQAMHQHP